MTQDVGWLSLAVEDVRSALTPSPQTQPHGPHRTAQEVWECRLPNVQEDKGGSEHLLISSFELVRVLHLVLNGYPTFPFESELEFFIQGISDSVEQFILRSTEQKPGPVWQVLQTWSQNI